jgi:hypothetical protein
MSVVSQLELCLTTARPKQNNNNNNNKENILIGVNIIIDAKIEKMLQIIIHCISQYQL